MVKLLAIFFLVCAVDTSAAGKNRLLNVSFDVAREFYAEYNLLFMRHFEQRHGVKVRIFQSHAGSSKQARAVIDGIPADVVTLNQPSDLDAIARRANNRVAKDWRAKFPMNAAPYTSCAAFMVRKGNPKSIRDWADLVRPGVVIVLPNPKTSGSGRYAYLGAVAFASRQAAKREAEVKEFPAALLANVPVLDSGGRAATTTFVQRKIGDVLLGLEAEILTTINEAGSGEFEIVYPSISVEAEMPVAMVERVVNRNGTRELAAEYLNFLYSDEAQDLLAKHFYRPRVKRIAQRHAATFPKVELVTVDGFFGGWDQVQKIHFAEGGTFDQIYATRN